MAEGAEGMTALKSKRKRFSKRPPDGPFGANAAWIHGGCGTPEYGAYTTAKTLCANPKNPRWAQYGGCGIEFRFRSFVSFMEHLGRCPAGKVLRRIDETKGTSKSATYTGRDLISAVHRKPGRARRREPSSREPRTYAGIRNGGTMRRASACPATLPRDGII
jgi:hypothetical protein